jgi:glycine/D-amino acid oxidase-like deaminating enzyme
VACYLEPPPELAAAWTAAPMVLDIDADAGFYLVPPRPGYGMKMGDHTFSLTGDPEADRTASAAERDAVIAHAAHRLTGFADYRVAETRTCFYTVQPEERFIVAPLGARGWVMTGFSGHGFKFGALMGEAMAAAIAGERPPEDLTSRAAGDAV